MLFPRWAWPFMRPRCCRRYFVRDGANNMAQLSSIRSVRSVSHQYRWPEPPVEQQVRLASPAPGWQVSAQLRAGAALLEDVGCVAGLLADADRAPPADVGAALPGNVGACLVPDVAASLPGHVGAFLLSDVGAALPGGVGLVVGLLADADRALHAVLLRDDAARHPDAPPPRGEYKRAGSWFLPQLLLLHDACSAECRADRSRL